MIWLYHLFLAAVALVNPSLPPTVQAIVFHEHIRMNRTGWLAFGNKDRAIAAIHLQPKIAFWLRHARTVLERLPDMQSEKRKGE